MTDAVSFSRNFIAQINTVINALEDVRLMQDRMTQEPGLSQAAAAAMNTAGRADLAKVDFDNAASAIGQILFGFDSGSPPQKSYLYKML